MELSTIKNKACNKLVTGMKYDFIISDTEVNLELHKVKVTYGLYVIDEDGKQLAPIDYIQDYSISGEPDSEFMKLVIWSSQPKNNAIYFLAKEFLPCVAGNCSLVIDELGVMKIKLEQLYPITLPYTRSNYELSKK